jgi:hypothetical protein
MRYTLITNDTHIHYMTKCAATRQHAHTLRIHALSTPLQASEARRAEEKKRMQALVTR